MRTPWYVHFTILAGSNANDMLQRSAMDKVLGDIVIADAPELPGVKADKKSKKDKSEKKDKKRRHSEVNGDAPVEEKKKKKKSKSSD